MILLYLSCHRSAEWGWQLGTEEGGSRGDFSKNQSSEIISETFRLIFTSLVVYCCELIEEKFVALTKRK